MELENKPDIVESVLQHVGEYAETRAELLKLTTVDKATELISLAAVRMAIYVMVSRTILFLCIATGFLLGEWFGSYSYGFFVVSTWFALAGIIVYIWRGKWVKDPVARLIITKVLG